MIGTKLLNMLAHGHKMTVFFISYVYLLKIRMWKKAQVFKVKIFNEIALLKPVTN